MSSIDALDRAYDDALTGIATGLDRRDVSVWIQTAHPSLTHDELNTTLNDALRDALKQGVEREDIDDSWF